MPKFIICEKVEKVLVGYRYISIEAEDVAQAFIAWDTNSGGSEDEEVVDVPYGFELVDESGLELDTIHQEFEYIKVDGKPETTMDWETAQGLAYPEEAVN